MGKHDHVHIDFGDVKDADHLMQQIIANPHKLFNLADTDDNGKLNFEELRNAIKHIRPTADDDEIKKIFHKADENKDKDISKREAIELMKTHFTQLSKDPTQKNAIYKAYKDHKKTCNDNVKTVTRTVEINNQAASPKGQHIIKKDQTVMKETKINEEDGAKPRNSKEKSGLQKGSTKGDGGRSSNGRK